MIPQYESSGVPDLSEVGGHWDPRLVHWHGPASAWDREPVALGRRVARIPGRDWPYVPEECQLYDNQRGEWICNGQVLVCPGCGIDVT